MACYSSSVAILASNASFFTESSWIAFVNIGISAAVEIFWTSPCGESGPSCCHNLCPSFISEWASITALISCAIKPWFVVWSLFLILSSASSAVSILYCLKVLGKTYQKRSV